MGYRFASALCTEASSHDASELNNESSRTPLALNRVALRLYMIVRSNGQRPFRGRHGLIRQMLVLVWNSDSRETAEKISLSFPC